MVKRPKPGAYLKSTPIVGAKPRKAAVKAAPKVEDVSNTAPVAPVEEAPRAPAAETAPVPAPRAEVAPTVVEPVLAPPSVEPPAPVRQASVEPAPAPAVTPRRGPTSPIAKPVVSSPVKPSFQFARLGVGVPRDIAVAAVFLAAIVVGGVVTWRIEQARAPAVAAAPVESLTSIEVVMQQIAPDRGADLTWEELFDRYQIEQTLRTRTLQLNAVHGVQPTLKDKVGLPRVKLVLSGNG
jgi:hypothetical protein